MKNVSDNVRKSKHTLLFSKIFTENRAVYEIMGVPRGGAV